MCFTPYLSSRLHDYKAAQVKTRKGNHNSRDQQLLENCTIKYHFLSEQADPFIAETSVLIILFHFGKVINPLVEIIMLRSFSYVLLRAHKEICDEMLGSFNERFIASSSLFEPLNIPHEESASICSDNPSVTHFFSFNSTSNEYKLLILLENCQE